MCSVVVQCLATPKCRLISGVVGGVGAQTKRLPPTSARVEEVRMGAGHQAFPSRLDPASVRRTENLVVLMLRAGVSINVNPMG